MIQIGHTAEAVLLENLVNASVPPQIGYRLAESEDGYKLRLDRPSDEDRVVEQEGHVLFMVDHKLDEALCNVVLRVKDGSKDRLVLETAPDSAGAGSQSNKGG